MSNKLYDVLKYIAMIVLPALAVLYSTLAGLWGLPYPKEISETIMAIDTFMGAILMLSSANYKKLLERSSRTNLTTKIPRRSNA